MTSREERLHEYLKAKRLAFLASWHPRAGNEFLRRRVDKNVGVLIAREYITLETQVGYRPKPRRPIVLLAKELPAFIVDIRHPHMTPHGMVMFQPFLYDRSLLLQDCRNITLQTPRLEITFGVKPWNREMGDGRHLPLRVDEDTSFGETLRNVDEAMRSQMQLNQDARFHGVVKDIKNYGRHIFFTFSELDHQNLPVFSGPKNSLQRCRLGQAIERGMLRQGAKVVAIFGRLYCWRRGRDMAGVKWNVIQLHVWPPKPRIDFSACQFIDDSE